MNAPSTPDTEHDELAPAGNLSSADASAEVLPAEVLPAELAPIALADGLTPAMHRCIELLLEGKSGPEAATVIGVDRKTVWRWRKEHPAFRRALQEARADALEEVSSRAHSLAKLSLDTLEKIMKSESATDADKGSAARTVLSRVVGEAQPTAQQPRSNAEIAAVFVERYGLRLTGGDG